MSGMEENVKVLVRLRPMPSSEIVEANSKEILSASGTNNLSENKELVSADESNNSVSFSRDKKGVSDFKFSGVLGTSSTQQDVFAKCSDIVTDVLKGINCCIMAYGQTSSGKTFTMLGKGWEDGYGSSGIGRQDSSLAGSRAGDRSRLLTRDSSPDLSVQSSFDSDNPDDGDEDSNLGDDVPNNNTAGIADPSQLQSVSKKSHGTRKSMSVDNDVGSAGVIPRCVEGIFQLLSSKEKESGFFGYSVHCQFMQIYNEKIFDLIQDKRRAHPLVIREKEKAYTTTTNANSNTTIYVQGLSEYRVHNKDDVISLITKGLRNRAVRSTDFNSESSRSHTILQMFFQVEEVKEVDGGAVMTRSTLSLVDLAGSEKWRPSLSQAGQSNIDVQKEMTNINTSLHVLGNCVSALIEPGRKHIPYRDSMLTRLLQDCLGGVGRTVLIATVHEAAVYKEETYSTLQFASRASNIKVTVVPSVVVSQGFLLERANKQIAALQSKLSLYQSGRAISSGAGGSCDKGSIGSCNSDLCEHCVTQGDLVIKLREKLAEMFQENSQLRLLCSQQLEESDEEDSSKATKIKKSNSKLGANYSEDNGGVRVSRSGGSLPTLGPSGAVNAPHPKSSGDSSGSGDNIPLSLPHIKTSHNNTYKSPLVLLDGTTCPSPSVPHSQQNSVSRPPRVGGQSAVNSSDGSVKVGTGAHRRSRDNAAPGTSGKPTVDMGMKKKKRDSSNAPTPVKSTATSNDVNSRGKKQMTANGTSETEVTRSSADIRSSGGDRHKFALHSSPSPAKVASSTSSSKAVNNSVVGKKHSHKHSGVGGDGSSTNSSPSKRPLVNVTQGTTRGQPLVKTKEVTAPGAEASLSPADGGPSSDALASFRASLEAASTPYRIHRGHADGLGSDDYNDFVLNPAKYAQGATLEAKAVEAPVDHPSSQLHSPVTHPKTISKIVPTPIASPAATPDAVRSVHHPNSGANIPKLSPITPIVNVAAGSPAPAAGDVSKERRGPASGGKGKDASPGPYGTSSIGSLKISPPSHVHSVKPRSLDPVVDHLADIPNYAKMETLSKISSTVEEPESTKASHIAELTATADVTASINLRLSQLGLASLTGSAPEKVAFVPVPEPSPVVSMGSIGGLGFDAGTKVEAVCAVHGLDQCILCQMFGSSSVTSNPVKPAVTSVQVSSSSSSVSIPPAPVVPTPQPTPVQLAAAVSQVGAASVSATSVLDGGNSSSSNNINKYLGKGGSPYKPLSMMGSTSSIPPPIVSSSVSSMPSGPYSNSSNAGACQIHGVTDCLLCSMRLSEPTANAAVGGVGAAEPPYRSSLNSVTNPASTPGLPGVQKQYSWELGGDTFGSAEQRKKNPYSSTTTPVVSRPGSHYSSRLASDVHTPSSGRGDDMDYLSSANDAYHYRNTSGGPTGRSGASVSSNNSNGAVQAPMSNYSQYHSSPTAGAGNALTPLDSAGGGSYGFKDNYSSQSMYGGGSKQQHQNPYLSQANPNRNPYSNSSHASGSYNSFEQAPPHRQQQQYPQGNTGNPYDQYSSYGGNNHQYDNSGPSSHQYDNSGPPSHYYSSCDAGQHPHDSNPYVASHQDQRAPHPHQSYQDNSHQYPHQQHDAMSNITYEDDGNEEGGFDQSDAPQAKASHPTGQKPKPKGNKKKKSVGKPNKPANVKPIGRR